MEKMKKRICLHKRTTNGMSGEEEKTGNFCSFGLPSPPWMMCFFREIEEECSFFGKDDGIKTPKDAEK